MGNVVPPLLVIVGETASGKTGLAIELAERLDGEIICADSSTVRQQTDIGSAKPTREERARVPHHLLDIIAPDQKFSAADFKTRAQGAIDHITSRGKLPILVGGSGLYIDSVLYDYEFLPEGDRAEREALNALNTVELLEKIAERGIELGSVDVHNRRRLIRLLETGGQKPRQNQLRENTCSIGIRIDRAVLKARIEHRVDAMLEQGLEQEVNAIAKQYGWHCEALKAVGYAQWREYFLGTQTLLDTRKKIVKATSDLAKRQRTWFKRNKSIHWLDYPIHTDDIVDLVTTSLDR